MDEQRLAGGEPLLLRDDLGIGHGRSPRWGSLVGRTEHPELIGGTTDASTGMVGDQLPLLVVATVVDVAAGVAAFTVVAVVAVAPDGAAVEAVATGVAAVVEEPAAAAIPPVRASMPTTLAAPATRLALRAGWGRLRFPLRGTATLGAGVARVGSVSIEVSFATPGGVALDHMIGSDPQRRLGVG